MAKGLIAVIIILFVLVFFNAVAGKSLFKSQPAPSPTTGAAVAGAPDAKVKGSGQ
jgi:hypothetical protein